MILIFFFFFTSNAKNRCVPQVLLIIKGDQKKKNSSAFLFKMKNLAFQVLQLSNLYFFLTETGINKVSASLDNPQTSL